MVYFQPSEGFEVESENADDRMEVDEEDDRAEPVRNCFETYAELTRTVPAGGRRNNLT